MAGRRSVGFGYLLFPAVVGVIGGVYIFKPLLEEALALQKKEEAAKLAASSPATPAGTADASTAGSVGQSPASSGQPGQQGKAAT